MNTIDFVLGKIKRYGALGIWKYIFVKYSCELLVRTPLRSIAIVRGTNFKVWLQTSSVARALYLFPNLHDGDVYEITRYIKPGGVLVDIGSNIGTITLPVAKHIGPTGTVYAVEAHPKTYRYLQDNIRLNKLTNVISYNVAVSNTNGVVSFSDITHDDMNHISQEISSQSIQVPAMRIDDLCAHIPHIDVLKIDVEGFEKYALEGARNTLKKTTMVYMEYFEQNCLDFGYRREELKSFLEQEGFSCTLSDPSIHQNPGIDNLIAVRVGV